MYCSENIKSIEISQAVGIHNLPGRLLKDGTITEIAEFVTFPLNREFFFYSGKLAKLRPIFRFGQTSKSEPNI